MNVGSYQRHNDVMLPSDAIESPHFEVHLRPNAEPQLPFYVRPAADEALISWLGRLASRFDLSPHQFASRAFGVDNRGPAQWWLRPSPLSLKRISELAGVPVDHLNRMTLNSWSPSYRGDEADGGFCIGIHRRTAGLVTWPCAQPVCARMSFRICGLLGLSVGLRCARDIKSSSSRAVPPAIRNCGLRHTVRPVRVHRINARRVDRPF